MTSRPLSYSAMSMYLECSQKYKFKYVDRIPEAPKYFFSFGQSVHEALEYFYGVPLPPPPSLEEVLAYYRKHWKKEGYRSPEQEAQYFTEGERILRGFYAKHAPGFKPPFFAEYLFNLEVDGVPVTGRVDRIDKLPSGKLSVLDYKTGKAFDLERVKTDHQLTMYQMACEELLGMPVERLTFYHLPTLTELTSERHSPDQVRALKKQIAETAESIQAARFEPKPEEWRCTYCDYKPLCPAWKHLYAVQEKAEAEVKPEDGLLSRKVDEYGKLKEEIKELQNRAEKIHDEILKNMSRGDYARAYGEIYEVIRHVEERWEFEDKKAVLDALKAHGLYEKVLAPSASAIQKLMKEVKLSAQARRDLESLGKKTESAVLRFQHLEEKSET